jgi:hypothetical protein
MDGPMESTSLAGIVLLGWKTRDEALRLLQEHCAFDRPPTDREAEALWARMRAQVNMLRGRRLPSPEPQAFTADECPSVDRFRASSQAAGQPPVEIVKIDPRPLVVYQLEVAIARSQDIASRLATRAAWVDEFLSAPHAIAQPSVRHAPNAIDVDVPHGEWGLLFDPARGFLVAEAARHVNVSRIADRLVLWGGYHRAYAAAAYAPRDGRTIIAAVSDEAARASAVVPRTCGLRAARSDNPPIFADFFDPQLAMPVPFKRKRFTLQIRARVVAHDVGQPACATPEQT